MGGGITGYGGYNGYGNFNNNRNLRQQQKAAEENTKQNTIQNAPQNTNTNNNEDNGVVKKRSHIDYTWSAREKIAQLAELPSGASGSGDKIGEIKRKINSYESSYEEYVKEYNTLMSFKAAWDKEPNNESLQEQYSNQLLVLREQEQELDALEKIIEELLRL